MKTKTNTGEKSRFDTKLSKEQKELFEYAASIGGYRTLTDFVVSTVEDKANEIIQKYKTILASEEDKKIFFDALLSDIEPNNRLKEAAKRHKEYVNKK